MIVVEELGATQIEVEVEDGAGGEGVGDGVHCVVEEGACHCSVDEGATQTEVGAWVVGAGWVVGSG